MALTLTRNVGEAIILQSAEVTYRLTVLTCGAGRVRFSALNLVTEQQVIRAIERGGSKWNIFGDVWLEIGVTKGRSARLVFHAPREVVILREELEAFAPDIRELRLYLRKDIEAERLVGKHPALGAPFGRSPTGRKVDYAPAIHDLPKRS